MNTLFPISASRALARRRGFTLMELMVSVAVMILMVGLAGPAVKNIATAQTVTQAVYDIGGLLEQARTFAMAQNTYVFVGVLEVDATARAGAEPEPTGDSRGRLVMAIAASRDGTPETGAGNLQAIDKLHRFENMHMADWDGAPPAGGNMARPAVRPLFNLGSGECESAVGFGWPLGANRPQYTFRKVIRFDPQGVASIPDNANSVPPQIELGLEPTRGRALVALPEDQNRGDRAALQINAITGSVQVYRP